MDLLGEILSESEGDENVVNVGSNGGLTIWYTGAVNQAALSTTTFAANTIYAAPVILPGGVLDTIAFETTATGAGSTTRVGIYANTSENVLYPSSLIVDGGSIDTHTAAGVKSTAINVALSPGLYWFVMVQTATLPTMRYMLSASCNHIIGLPPTMGASLNPTITVAFAYAALPASFPAGAATNTVIRPLIAVHYSA